MKEMLSEELLLQIKSHNDKGLYFEQYDPSPVIYRMYHDIRSLQQQVDTMKTSWVSPDTAKAMLNDIGDRNESITSLEQQVNTLTEALGEIDRILTGDDVDAFDIGECRRLITEALQSIKESPREEQGK